MVAFRSAIWEISRVVWQIRIAVIGSAMGSANAVQAATCELIEHTDGKFHIVDTTGNSPHPRREVE